MVFDLKFNLAALEIGSWISTFLFGIVTSQAYFYYSHYSRQDRWQLKLLVVVVWLCELAHTCSRSSGFFTVSIIHYNEATEIFSKSAVGYTISTFMVAVIASLVQVYFGYRVLAVTRKPYVAYACWSLSFLRFMGGTGMTYLLATKSLAEFQGTWLAAATWAVGVAVDITIAVTLTRFYIKCRREAIKLKRLFDHLIPVTMQTGLLTSISTVAVAICFVAMPYNLVWAVVGPALANIFSISLLASLNARSFLRELAETSDDRLSPSPLGFATDTPSDVLDARSSPYHNFPQESGHQPGSLRTLSLELPYLASTRAR